VAAHDLGSQTDRANAGAAGFVPAAPPGATIASMLTLGQMLGTVDRSLPVTYELGFHGFGAAQIASTHLAGKFSIGELLMNHSAAPLLFGNMIDTHANEACLDWAAGRRQWLDRWLPRPFPSVRHCPVCAKADEAEFGFVFARVIHQFQPVRHCHLHGVSLELSCVACEMGVPNIGPVTNRQTVARCATCGGSERMALEPKTSAGYVNFIELLTKALRGEAPYLRAPRVRAILRHGVNVAGDTLIRNFGPYWDCGSFEAACDACNVSAARMRLLLTDSVLPAKAYEALASVSYVTHVLKEQGICYEGAFSPLIVKTPPSELEQELAGVCSRLGIDTRLAVLLAQGNSYARIARLGFSLSDSRWVVGELSSGARRLFDARKKRRYDTVLSAATETQPLYADLVLRHREALMSTVRRVPEARLENLLRYQGSGLPWLLKHDNEWLFSMYPELKQVQQHEKDKKRQNVLAEKRQKVVALLETDQQSALLGNTTRRSFRRVLMLRARALYKWMLVNDREWLEEAVPARETLKLDIDIAREKARFALASGIETRVELANWNRRITDYLRRFDPKFLDTLLPRYARKRHSRPQELENQDKAPK